jgi:osmotically-inducible protein OsmY
MSTSRNLTVLMLAAAMAGGAYAKADGEDAKISAEVQKRIDERPSLRFYNISVRTFDHVVYLEGLVDTNFDRSQTEAITRTVPGVTKVYDKLSLNGNGWPSTRALNGQASSTRAVEGQASAVD